ncbi:MAG: sigma-54-dependent Fis family transcriptional regulator [Thermoanaerobaculia bacterium]
MASSLAGLAEKLRLLQLETLYDLAVALHAERSEEQLLDELLERVCSVLDPSAAVVVTRDSFGGARALASVGWGEPAPEGGQLLADPLWRQLLASGGAVARQQGQLAGRPFHEMVATPLAYRNVYLGYMALLDKETRGGEAPAFSEDDRRFLDSVAALAGVSLDGARRLERLARERERLAEENKLLKDRWAVEVASQRVVAMSEEMRRVLEVVERVAPRSVSVLVRGESGTGKELIAKLIHLRSGRTGSMIALNCSALPEGLVESELFGIEGGVATGVTARPGKFELAEGGTLFLDEIGDLQPSVQVKLLRVLQEREVTRVGGKRPISVDVRMVAATHRDLKGMVAAGSFREDLFYRLQGVEVLLPPLRERREEIPHLVRLFTEDFCRREGIAPPIFHAEALAILIGHGWPGNVRELRNLVEGAVSLGEGEVGPDLVRSLLGTSVREAPGEQLELSLLEHRHIEQVLRLTQGNKSAAARILGVNRRTLARKGF